MKQSIFTYQSYNSTIPSFFLGVGVRRATLHISYPLSTSIPVQRQLFVCGDFRRSLPHHFIYSSPPPGIRLLLQPSKMLLQIPVHSLPQVIRFIADGNAIQVKTERICIWTEEEDVNKPAPRHIAIWIFASSGMELKHVPHFLAKDTPSWSTCSALHPMTE